MTLPHGHIVVQQIRLFLGALTSHTRVPGTWPGCCAPASHERQQVMAQLFGSLPLVEKAWWSSRYLASAWAGSGHIGSSVDGKWVSLSLSLSLSCCSLYTSAFQRYILNTSSCFLSFLSQLHTKLYTWLPLWAMSSIDQGLCLLYLPSSCQAASKYKILKQWLNRNQTVLDNCWK